MATSFIEVDKYALDEEWEKQPKLYLKWAKRLADAKETLAAAKAKLDVVRAEVSMDIRANPDKYKMAKPTEDGIKIRVLLHVDCKAALKAHDAAQHEVDLIEAAVKALDHRKKALENLVFLHGQSYFAAPKMHRQASAEQREEMETRAKHHVREKARPKKRHEDDD